MPGGSSRRYPQEVRERAVPMVAEVSDQHESEGRSGSMPAHGPGTTTEEFRFC